MKYIYKGDANYYRINIDIVFDLFENRTENTVFIDVRKPSEWEKGVIPGAFRITLDNLPEHLKNFDHNKQYILICSYGGRSGLASAMMSEKGFINICNFQGGMLEWYEKGYPLEFPDFLSLPLN